ncbi:MAG TPA: Fic family protein [Parafilimonas sp.]|nr:Fic family protein [Parafilimonas sp.]
MRRIVKYIYELRGWPGFNWKESEVTSLLANVRHRQGRLLGRMEGLGFNQQQEVNLKTLTSDIVKSSEIEGEILNPEQVRSSIARRLGMEIAGLAPTDRNVDGIVEMMLDATQNYKKPLSNERLFDWHAALFPTGRSGMHKIVVGAWRNNSDDDPMQVVSGAMGKEKVHYEAPASSVLQKEMNMFIGWFNKDGSDPVIKAAIAHLWFVTIHPFDDGNGRIARAITDMQLARADESSMRFYSMSFQIRQERKQYYDILEKTQKGGLDITKWIIWFLQCIERSLDATDELLGSVFGKAQFWDKHTSIVLNNRQKLLINKLLDGFTGKLTSSKWAKIAKCSQDTALRDIQDLLQKNILEKEPAGGRSTSYILKHKK